jgi:hypothetical protein
MQSVLAILVLLVPIWVALQRAFRQGLYLSIAVWAVVTDRLSISVGAFELTIQRLVLLLVVFYWLSWIKTQHPKAPIPFSKWLIVSFGANLCSLLISSDLLLSLKWFLSYSTEFVLFYVIISTSLTDRESLIGLIKALCIGSAVVAVFGIVEYYGDTNLALLILGVASGLKGDGVEKVGVLVTFQHRILLGYAMAMGWPLFLALAQSAKVRSHYLVLIGFTMADIACCYFSESRGPWCASALAGVVMLVLGSERTRRRLGFFMVLIVLVTLIRPGVRETLENLISTTFDPTSYRGKSYAYRKELWPVAMRLANSSPERALFGHGALTTEKMDLGSQFQYGGSSALLGYTSWDNNYAADLVEFGYVGLAIEIGFNSCILIALWRSARRCDPAYRDLGAALLAVASVYVFALTNVYMFSPQLKCIFWVCVVCGSRLGILNSHPRAADCAVGSAGSTQMPQPGSEAAMNGRALGAPISLFG